MEKSSPTNGKLIRLLISLLVFMSATVVFLGHRLVMVQAEQSGGSPESGAESRLVQIYNTIEDLSYARSESGNWGDWGEHWNAIYRAATTPFNHAVANPQYNGSNDSYPVEVGGIDDPSSTNNDSYSSVWITCGASNNYCGTGNSEVETVHGAKLDTNTGLIWTNRLSSTMNWHTANNCEINGSCGTGGGAACECVKRTVDKTGCEAIGEGWRLPHQKELLTVFVNGAYSNLTDTNTNYWSATSYGNGSRALYVVLSSGFGSQNLKVSSYSVKCVYEIDPMSVMES